jgi:hypothetical protein
MGGLLLILVYVLFARNETNADVERSVQTALTVPQTIIVIAIAATILLGIPVSVYWFIDRVTNWTDRQIRLHRIGQRGEERVVDAMYYSLDGDWWLFRNLDLPGQKLGDIDLILIGSGGVWVLEVKSYHGEFRVVGQRWERRIGNYWLPAFKNPSRQAKRNAAALSHLLGMKNIKQWITPVIVWANSDSKLTIENPDVHIWHLNQIADVLNELKNKASVSEEQKATLVEIFKNLYKEPFQPISTS